MNKPEFISLRLFSGKKSLVRISSIYHVTENTENSGCAIFLIENPRFAYGVTTPIEDIQKVLQPDLMACLPSSQPKGKTL